MASSMRCTHNVRFSCPNMDCPVKVEGPKTSAFFTQDVTALAGPTLSSNETDFNVKTI